MNLVLLRKTKTECSAEVAQLLWEHQVAGSIPAIPIALRGKLPLCASRTVVMSHIRINYGRGSGYDI